MTIEDHLAQAFDHLVKGIEGVQTFTYRQVEYAIIVDQGVMYVRPADMAKYPISHIPPKRR